MSKMVRPSSPYTVRPFEAPHDKPSSPYHKVILRNGVRFVLVPQNDTKTATILVLIGTGSKYEDKRNNGISHFLEHMFFKGTKKRPTQLQIAEPLDRIGGMFNAFTGEDFTGYFAKIDRNHADLAIDWVSDILLNSLFPEKEIRKEKSVVLEELHMHKDTPMSYVQVLWTRLLYGDQPAGWDIVGTEETIQGFSRRDLKEYVKSQYVASNTVVCVAGNVDPSDMEKRVEELFGALPAANFRGKQQVVEYQTKPEAHLEYRKTDQTHIAFGARGYNLFHPQRYAQEILATILGGMMSSRLFARVRDRLGLAYYIGSSSETNPDTGYLVTTAGVKNERVPKAITAIREEYGKIAQRMISLDELQKAKDHIKGKMALQLESSDAKAYFYGMQELLEKTMATPEEICDRINAVSREDVLKAAQDFSQPSTLNLVVLGPFQDKEKFEQILETS